ncbi:S8 family serine peptidase, partial [Desulfosarcina sp.]|uniref:S8 family serine peptidase n=1 Tax=Desulfosarcina sp. TaxID=2027861 RepID=UPI0029A95ACE
LPQAWDYTTGDSDVIVAVIDSGVLMNHPDLNDRLTGTGYDFISSTSISNDGDGIDDDPDDPGNTTTGTSSFHGTHCAGTVAAETNNGSGLAGVTWDTQIMPVRILGVGGGTLYDLMQGIRYAAGLSNDSGITLNATQRADIISMSLGGGGYSVSTQNVINQARSAGVIIIAAAGNKSTATPFYPASYDGVISVSAVNINGTLASYSNYGSDIDVAAPGGDAGDYDGDSYADRVWSTCGNDSSGSIQYNYVAYYGTSMATPHVAGVVALMKSLDQALTPTGLDTLLSSGAITNDIGNTGRDDYYGHGLIDALKAVVAVNSGDVPTALNVGPTTVNFGTSSTSATVMVSKIGSDAISVADVSDDGNWLSVFATSVDGDGLGSYTLEADRTGLSDGTHLATATFTSSLGSSVTVQVSLQISSANVAYDAGYHYVRLVDADDYSILAQDNVQASGGTYTYAFNNVPQGGTYLIMAGSDRDNDGNIDNPAESRGAYLSLDQIIYVEATGNLSGLDFATDLKLTISTSGLSTESD